jgi:hypothetical protein
LDCTAAFRMSFNKLISSYQLSVVSCQLEAGAFTGHWY